MARGLKTIVVDVGNTSTALGLWSEGEVTQVAHCDGGFEEACAEVRRLKEATGAGRLAYISVVPSKDDAWKVFADREGLEFHQVGLADCLHAATFTFDYPEPATIGADRLADAVGAIARYGAPLIVMDFGTALTAAVITHENVWRGGVIAPGFPLMRDYLFERTARLPRMELGTGKAPRIGRSTEEAMRFGALVGYRGMVREIVTELTRNFNESFHLVATGGFAKWVLADLDLPFTIDPTLTLYGAGLLCEQNS